MASTSTGTPISRIEQQQLERVYARQNNEAGVRHLMDAQNRGEGSKDVLRGAIGAAAVPTALGMSNGIFQQMNEVHDARQPWMPFEAVLAERPLQPGGSPRGASEARKGLAEIITNMRSEDPAVRDAATAVYTELFHASRAPKYQNAKVPLREMVGVLGTRAKDVAWSVAPLAAIGGLAGFLRHRSRLKKRNELLREASQEKSAESHMELSPEAVEAFWQEVAAINTVRDTPAQEKTASPAHMQVLMAGFADELEKIGHEKTAIFGFLKKLWSGAGGEVAGATRSAAQSRLAQGVAASRSATPPMAIPRPSIGTPKGPSPSANSLNTPRAEALRQKAGGAAAIQQRLKDRQRGEALNPGGKVDFGNKEDYGFFGGSR